jgi:hypothetical protein
MGCMRNKNVLLCPLSALAFNFLFRWGFQTAGGSKANSQPHSKTNSQPHRTLPSFSAPHEFYNIHVFPGKISEPKKQWAYSGQREWTNKLFKGAGIITGKSTHSGRRQAARHAELAGVEKSQIRRAGHWNSDSITNSYLSCLPRKFMRTIAGFREERGGFYLPRAKVDPPEALQRQIWPEIDGWLQKYAEFDPHAVNNAVERPNLAGAGFLRLLKYLRRIILQDSVILRDMFPDHPI